MHSHPYSKKKKKKSASKLAPKCDLTQAVRAAKLRLRFFSFCILGICAVGWFKEREGMLSVLSYLLSKRVF